MEVKILKGITQMIIMADETFGALSTNHGHYFRTITPNFRQIGPKKSKKKLHQIQHSIFVNIVLKRTETKNNPTYICINIDEEQRNYSGNMQWYLKNLF